MKYLKSFENISDISNRESQTRTKKLTEEEFLQILNDRCKNFSFSNDLLWRGTDTHFGEYGLFFEKERKGTYGNYNYKDFFDLRKEYPVPRYKSLIGSTEKPGAELLSSWGNSFLVIPFDNSQIVFAATPDLALWSNMGVEFTDDKFIMAEYTRDFKVPEKLSEIRDELKTPYKGRSGNFGFEFFTTSPCLLLKPDKIDWLKGVISEK